MIDTYLLIRHGRPSMKRTTSIRRHKTSPLQYSHCLLLSSIGPDNPSKEPLHINLQRARRERNPKLAQNLRMNHPDRPQSAPFVEDIRPPPREIRRVCQNKRIDRSIQHPTRHTRKQTATHSRSPPTNTPLCSFCPPRSRATPRPRASSSASCP